MFSEYFCIMFACCIVLRTLKPSSFLTFCMWTIFFLLSEVCRIFIPQSIKLHSVMCLWMYFHSLYLSALVPFKYLFDFFSLIHFLYFLWFSKPKYKACFECWLGEWGLDLQPKSVIINCHPCLTPKASCKLLFPSSHGSQNRERMCPFTSLLEQSVPWPIVRFRPLMERISNSKP